MTNCHFILEPLLTYLKRTLQQDRVIACDDTGVTLLYPKVLPEFDLANPQQLRDKEGYRKALRGNKPSINTKMWAYRSARVKLEFDFTVSRHREGPELFFENLTARF